MKKMYQKKVVAYFISIFILTLAFVSVVHAEAPAGNQTQGGASGQREADTQKTDTGNCTAHGQPTGGATTAGGTTRQQKMYRPVSGGGGGGGSWRAVSMKQISRARKRRSARWNSRNRGRHNGQSSYRHSPNKKNITGNFSLRGRRGKLEDNKRISKTLNKILSRAMENGENIDYGDALDQAIDQVYYGGGGNPGGVPNSGSSSRINDSANDNTLPEFMTPATEDATWQVSPATRNLRLEVTPFYYEPPFGPVVHLTYVYIRERYGKNKWWYNYNSYLRSESTSRRLGLANNYSTNTVVQIQITRPSGHTVEYFFKYEENTLITPKTSPDMSMPSGWLNRSAKKPDRLFITKDFVFVIKKDNSYEKYSRDDRNGRLMAISDKQGHILSFQRDRKGHLEAIIDAAGATTTVEYVDTVITFTDPSGKQAVVDYNSNNEQLGLAISTAGTTNEFEYYRYYDEPVLTKLTVNNKTYEFTPEYTTFNRNEDLQKWSKLNITSDFGYYCIYDWEDNTNMPENYSLTIKNGSYYTNNAIDAYCVSTDANNGGERKIKYYISGRNVHAKDNLINGTWTPAERYYYESKNNTKGQRNKVVFPMADGTERITLFGYNKDEQLISEKVETSSNSFETVYACEITPFGDKTSETSPEGKVIYSYTNIFNIGLNDKTNWFKLVRAIRGPNGATVLYEYDDKGRIAKKTICANSSTYVGTPFATALQNVSNNENNNKSSDETVVAVSTMAGIGQVSCSFSFSTYIPCYTYNIIVTPDTTRDRVFNHTYAENGFLETVTDPDGIVTYFTYNKAGNLTEKETIGNGGYYVAYTYDNAGRVLSADDYRAGKSIKNLYDRFGICSMTNAANIAFDSAYDYAGRKLFDGNQYGMTEANGYSANEFAPPLWTANSYGTSTFTYINNSSPIKTVFPDNSTIEISYDSQFGKKDSINQLGGVTSFKYSDFGRTTIVSNHVTGVTASNTKDLAGRIISSSVSDGSTSTFSYSADKLVSKTASDAGTINFWYNKFGELSYTRNQHNYVVKFSYDKTGFLTGTSNSLGRIVTKTKYGSSSLPATVTDARGETTTFGYDDALNNTTITTPDGITTTKSHDLMGRVTSVVHGASAVFTEYDDIGRVTSVSKKSTADKFIKVENEYFKAQPKPVKTRSFYEQNGIRNQRETSFVYDNCGRVKRVQDAANNVVETLYNGLGLVTNIVAPNQHSASFEFDKSGRLIREKDFRGRESTISYNANERTTTVTRPDSTTVKTLKDTQGRIRSVVSSSDDEISRTRNFIYRNDGKLLSNSVSFAGNNYISGSFVRNSAGELNSKIELYNNLVSYNINYDRDEGGLISSVSFGTEQNFGTTKTYTHDEMGRISRVQAGDVDVEYQYNSDNRVSIIFNNMNFSISHFSYDNAGRRTNSHYRSFYGETATINNQYDSYAAARLKQQQLSFNGTPTRVHNYDYDIIDQISSEQTLVNGNQIDYNSYNYNGFGDRTCGVENVTHIFDVNYPDANTIRKTSDSLTKAFLSDTRGNLIQIKERRIPTLFFEYDTDNNMIGAEINGTNWTFRYNSQNQMYYSKIVDDYETVIDERFYIYDGLDCIAETDTDGTILREYIRIGNVGGIVAEIRHGDQTCAQGYQSGTFYYHYNHRGDVIAVSSHNGSIVFKADYDAYGKITRIDSGSFEPRYTFSTKRYFGELGLYYYGYRWYLPELGRWTTKDPIGHLSGDLNLYEFCLNNPLFSIDEYGLASLIETGRSHTNSSHWSFWRHNSRRFRFMAPKCNEYVYDMIKKSGLNDPSVLIDSNNPKSGKRPPTASEWADPDVNIPGWTSPHNNPQPGDVVSDGRHCGILTEDGTVISASSETNKVEENKWGINNPDLVGRTPCK